jgi:hypothetical protein
LKVFLSWSGTRSRDVANLLSDWLGCVIQAARPWVSTRDLDRGSLWFGEINDQLQNTSVGVICLTQENKNRPWILFEAGALAKGLSTARVCTFLIDLEPKDIEDPLAQFNHTAPGRDNLHSLVKTINGSLGIAALDNRILDQVFETYWPQFESQFKAILDKTESALPAKPRSKDDVLDEILEATRALTSRMRRLEIEIDSDPKGRKFFRPTPAHARMEISELVRMGMPRELILDKFDGVVPTGYVMDIIAEHEEKIAKGRN